MMRCEQMRCGVVRVSELQTSRSERRSEQLLLAVVDSSRVSRDSSSLKLRVVRMPHVAWIDLGTSRENCQKEYVRLSDDPGRRVKSEDIDRNSGIRTRRCGLTIERISLHPSLSRAVHREAYRGRYERTHRVTHAHSPHTGEQWYESDDARAGEITNSVHVNAPEMSNRPANNTLHHEQT
jgi:hypothetical protein